MGFFLYRMVSYIDNMYDNILLKILNAACRL